MNQIMITGASRGIGKAIAVRFAEEGWNLAICSRNQQDLSAVREELLQISPSSRILALSVDVSDRLRVEAFAERTLSEYGTVDILVNNAGIFIPGKIYAEESGVMEHLLRVNLFGAYHLTRAVLKNMIPRRCGHIFNICSTASLKAYPDGGSYSISKFALLGFSKNLREELMPHQIRVTSICPGAVWTDSWKGSGLPESRMTRAEDVAELVWMSWKLPPSSVVEEILLRPMQGDIS
jgi:NADP-dependent 3-hydroxy acid dehydrogenase YdfG